MIEHLDLAQKVFIATIAGFKPDYAAKYISSEVDYISYMAPPAYFAASKACSDVIRWMTRMIPSQKEPYTFYFDLETGNEYDMALYGKIIGETLYIMQNYGTVPGVKRWKQLMEEHKLP